MVLQHTLQSSVTAVGVGLHSGAPVQLSIHPAPEDFGIRFRRVDVVDPVDIRMRPQSVTDTRMNSTIGTGDNKVGTVEHLMSALAGLGVDNCLVELDAPEVPIMDGSAAGFVLLIQQAGLKPQSAARRFVRIIKPVEVRQGEGAQLKWAKLTPFDGFKLRFTISFEHPAIDATEQDVEVNFADSPYPTSVARARTFGFVNEVEYLRANGLARGGSLQNAIVMDEMRVLNADGLRSEDEFAKHKILDAVGDLYLLGAPLIAAYHGFRSGHAMNNQLLRALLADPSSYEWVTYTNETVPPGVLLPTELIE